MSNPQEKPQPASPTTAASRRKFLQGAALATAAVAATGAAGAAIAEARHTDLPHVIQSFGLSHGLISGAHSGGCLTKTGPFQPLPNNQITSSTGEHSFMLWFWVNNVPESPSGITYTLTYTLAKVSGPGPAAVSPFPTPFTYSGSGNNQHNYILDDNTAGCPGTVPTPNGNGKNIGDIGAVTLKGPVGTHKDILWQLHLQWNSSPVSANTVYQFTGTVTDSLGNTISSSITITVTP